MAKRRGKTLRYSTCFKLQVVKEFEEEGLSLSELSRKYGIKGGSTVRSWIKKYGKNHLLNKVIRIETMNEQDELKRLREENKRLKIAYAELSLNHKCSEAVIEISDEMFGLDLKKKVRTRVIKKLSQEEKVSSMCEYFEISRNAYYNVSSI